MLGINIAGEFLDLSPGTTAILERTSPFFDTESLTGEYTFPFTLPYTPKNARLLGLVNHFYTKRIKIRISARLYDNNNFAYSGQLVIDTASLDVNDITKSSINGFFVLGVSSFFQEIKNKKLKELQLGGARVFAWTNNDPLSPDSGFWRHIHDTLDGLMQYSFAPIRNSMWAGNDEDGTPDWMNKPNVDGTIAYEDNAVTLAPQISLQYILEQACAEQGWRFDGSFMGTEQWKTLFMPSFYAVTWCKVLLDGIEPFANITINLANHMPPETLISDLFIALRNKYNWGFDFDSELKVCKMFPIKNLVRGRRKDWTAFMEAKWDSDFSEDEKIFAFKNDFDGNDGFPSEPDLKSVTILPAIEKFADLPTADETNYLKVIFAWKDNQYYQNIYNEDDNTYQWIVYTDNIYNYEPDGANAEFDSAISTMPVYKTLFRTDGFPTDWYITVPLCEQEGNWEGKQGQFVPWGMRLLLHRGKVYEGDIYGNQGTVKYCYLTSIAFTPTQTEPDLDWSNVYVHVFDGNDKGIVNYWWKDTLKYLKQSDVITGRLTISRIELRDFAWSDIIVLRNTQYIMQKMREIIPYDGTVQAQLRRIG